ncbi:MAG: polysaccharide biosynthesis/export family protein [Phycisphaerales bacterium]|nr:polysaccharide biosynthesis/export family protein [Phycisphaerales bacterium]
MSRPENASVVVGSRGNWKRRAAFVLSAAGGAGLMLAMGGCEVDSFLDPSVVGRWEHTPTVVPILERLTAIESADSDFVEYSDVTPEDLIPFVAASAIAPGDALSITIRDFFRVGQVDAPLQVQVDQEGNIELPRLGRINVQGLTPTQAKDKIVRAVEDGGYMKDAAVSVIPLSQRKQMVSIFGAVAAPGMYNIPSPDYRLLEALTSAGGFTESVNYVYVIRQVPLTQESALPGAEAAPPSGEEAPIDAGQQGDRMIDLIDELSRPDPAPAPVETPAGGDASPTGDAGAAGADQPAGEQPSRPPIGLPDTTPGGNRDRAVAPSNGDAAQPPLPAPDQKYNWVYLDGKWVKAGPDGRAFANGGSESDALVTQRVIQVPMAPLVAGSARVNIIVRPGDVIRIPAANDGFYYLEGTIARPGAFGLPPGGSITLTRAIASAGGLAGIAIPERVDLTRMVGDKRQATIRLNYKAIKEGTQPDIYLKPDDLLTFGTNFWAYPLAVIRSGLRASYGYGFILDRNFGTDVFGAPPTNFQQ